MKLQYCQYYMFRSILIIIFYMYSNSLIFKRTFAKSKHYSFQNINTISNYLEIATSRFEEILVYNKQQNNNNNNILNLLVKMRPNLKIYHSNLVEKDKYIWTNYCDCIQMDCAVLEDFYLGKNKLSDLDTVLKWNEMIKSKLNNDDTKHYGDGGKLQLELDVSAAIVERASYMTRSLQKLLASKKQLDKVDFSPVTIADFAAQALIIDHLSKAFPADLFIAEEDSTFLQNAPEVSNYILDVLSLVTNRMWTKEELFDVLDKGRYNGTIHKKTTVSSSEESQRIWVLDPIDGTKGFLRGEHFCIGLGLLVDGIPQLSVLGCPNLNLPRALQGISYDHKSIGFIDPPILSFNRTSATLNADEILHIFSASSGSIYFAVSHCGAFAKSLSMPLGAAFEVSTSNLKDDQFVLCESAEAAFGNRVLTKKIATILQLTNEYIRIDGMCKHCIVAIGAVEGLL